ncbi:TadE family type IV pilus minor pilin [Kribbella solani]|uniref:TadE family type IV pilus minor pilin n=1 Tax=Kribbella solani TaxID=236067 RepID=UPI003B58661A
MPTNTPMPAPVRMPSDKSVPAHITEPADGRVASDAPEPESARVPDEAAPSGVLADVSGTAGRLSTNDKTARPADVLDVRVSETVHRASPGGGGCCEQHDQRPQPYQHATEEPGSFGADPIRSRSRRRSRGPGRGCLLPGRTARPWRTARAGRTARVGRTDRAGRGAVTAELAIVLPMLLSLLLLGVWAIGLVILNLQCIDAARDVARAVARGESPDEAQAIGQRAIPGGTVAIARDGSDVRVTVSAAPRRTPPLIGRLFAPRLTATAVLQVEPEIQ